MYERTREEVLPESAVSKLRSDLRSRFPEAFSPCAGLATGGGDGVPTGIPALETLLPRGYPRGGVVMLSGAGSAGKTAVALAALGALARARPANLAGWIDVPEALLPSSVEGAGVDLGRLVVVRPGSLESALRAADVLLRNEAFAVVVLDVGRETAGLPRGAMARLARMAARKGGTLVVIGESDRGRSSAATLEVADLVLHVERRGVGWEGPRDAAAGLRALRSRVRVEKGYAGPPGAGVEIVFDARDEGE